MVHNPPARQPSSRKARVSSGCCPETPAAAAWRAGRKAKANSKEPRGSPCWTPASEERGSGGRGAGNDGRSTIPPTARDLACGGGLGGALQPDLLKALRKSTCRKHLSTWPALRCIHSLAAWMVVSAPRGMATPT